MSSEPELLLELSVRACLEAGALLQARFEGGTEQALSAKSSPTDLVSEADLSSQQAIRRLLRSERPSDGFLGEEDGDDVEGSSGLRWVVDPLDGTINFLFGIPQWCVSVAVEDGEGTIAGAVHDPLRKETYTGLRGGPAMLNGTQLEGSTESELGNAMVATGLAYDAAVRRAQGSVLARLVSEVRDVRRFGAAALDLAWCAAGRYDAYFERTVKPWDIAAGALVCRCAGLEVRELDPAPDLPFGILAAPPALAGALHQLVG